MFRSALLNNYPRLGVPPEPRPLRPTLDRQEATLSETREVEDRLTRGAVEEQERAGLDIVTDGQLRGENAQTYLTRGLAGFEHAGRIRYFDTDTTYRQPVAETAIRWEQPILVRDFQFAQALTSRPVKAVLTGPYTLARLSLDRHYSSLPAFVADLARALNHEAKALEAAGASHIQIDEPALTRHREDLDLAAEAVEAVVAGLSRASTSLATYFGDVCWGLERLDRLPVTLLGLDVVSNDHYPKALSKLSTLTKGLALGIVDARNSRLESVEDTLALLESLRPFLKDREVHLQPNAGLEILPRSVAIAKLEVLSALALEANEVFA